MPVKPDILALAKRPAILQLLACVVVGAAVLLAGGGLLERERRANRQALDELSDVRSRLARIDIGAVDIPADAERYRQMVASGHLGPERRLEWIERIALIKAERRLLELRYEFSPQKPLDATATPVGGASGFEFMSSTMKLQMDLLHEDDLLGFLDDLAGGVPALLQARACTLERLQPGPGAGNMVAQLKADCTIDWITLKEKA